MVARLIIASVLYSLVFLISIFHIAICGFMINLFPFGLLGLIYLYFFFWIGVLVGMIPDKWNSIIIAGAIYFILVFLVPWVINKVHRFSSTDIESYFNFELKSTKIYASIESRLLKEFSQYKSGDPSSEKIKAIIKDGLREIFDRELKLRARMFQIINTCQLVSSVCPSSFFLSMRGEGSSKGLSNLIKFYTFSHEMKRDFLNFYLQRRYNKSYKPGRGNIESFIKGDENIFRAQPRLPYAFWVGVGLTLFYIVLLLFFSYRKFVRMTAESPAGTTAGRPPSGNWASDISRNQSATVATESRQKRVAAAVDP